MARFVINNKLYDTSKMLKVGEVKKWYEYTGFLFRQMYGKGVGRKYDCELFCSEKGNWLLTHDGENGLTGEAISEREAKDLLVRYDYESYSERFGELEEA